MTVPPMPPGPAGYWMHYLDTLEGDHRAVFSAIAALNACGHRSAHNGQILSQILAEGFDHLDGMRVAEIMDELFTAGWLFILGREPNGEPLVRVVAKTSRLQT